MKHFNLSEWAITHRALVLFMILLIGVAGLFSYYKLGRAEDPSFTIKVMNIHVGWPGATAAELQTQVVDKIEKKLQDLPHLDRVTSYSQPGTAFIQVNLSDTTPPSLIPASSNTLCSRFFSAASVEVSFVRYRDTSRNSRRSFGAMKLPRSARTARDSPAIPSPPRPSCAPARCVRGGH